MSDSIDDYPDLNFGQSDTKYNDDYQTAMAKKKFFVPEGNDEVGVGRSLNFLCSPTVVHFGGFTIFQDHEQTVSVINSSSHSQRLSILPPPTDEFKVYTITTIHL
jgi:hypothetical protein